jgi:hypothetical protein
MVRIVLVLAFALLGCGPKHTHQCPGNAAGPCAFNDEVCSFDQKRGCQVCQCRPMNGSSSNLTEPDAQGLPPEPTH